MLGSATKELPQLTDPGKTQWHSKQPVEDTKYSAAWGLWGNISISYKKMENEMKIS